MPNHQRTNLLLKVGAALLLTGTGILAAIPPLYGTARPRISVALRDIDETQRRQFERDFDLLEGVRLGPDVWLYVPNDTQADRLRALLAHPAVLATDGIDKRRARISPDASLTARRGGLISAPPVVSRTTKFLAYSLLVLGVSACLGAIMIHTGRVSGDPPTRATILAAVASVGGFLQRGVPIATPRAAGLFRMVFGALVLWFVRLAPASRGGMHAEQLIETHGPYGFAVRWMAHHPASLGMIDAALLTSGLLFVAGIWTRVSFAAFVVGFLAWVSVYTVETSMHTISALSLAVVCLSVAPWGDGASVDAWWRRRRGAAIPAAGRRYGYAIWVPGFVFGLTFLAAAWAKVGGGPAWILNGTVKYHFLADLDHALVQWGPQLTRHHASAVALSAAAVAIEVLVITAAFVSSARYRLAVGVCALSLLVGFRLFQGVYWPSWWMLLLGFLPWQHMREGDAGREPSAESSLSRPQTYAIALVVAQQTAMSLMAIDARPFFSMYDMYSATHGTADDLYPSGAVVYRVVADTADGWMSLPGCSVNEQVAARVGRTLGDLLVSRSALDPALAQCLLDWPNVKRVRLDGDRQEFDWSTGRLEWRRRVDMIGPLQVD